MNDRLVVIVNATTSTTWAKRVSPHLESLAAKSLKDRRFYELKVIASLLDDMGIVWERMLDENKERYLEQAMIDFHPKGMGEIYGDAPDYRALYNLIDAELREVRRRRR